ncbi:FAD linked oxidase N-terminal [Penicillium macrosclerotiorum]|uniref:FAD linked oxidase N-terminal n=1 Tax=Penicillium macrosclerotiorum TaxID=303699 RepID=UPI0025484A20|nr:FAD linked oxidase N-terminal [Penicillium macrosclerotiorum]KAJ5673996.1 FAD linked oxidase N-terminal [Penicillium macrosclerotiorum]
MASIINLLLAAGAAFVAASDADNLKSCLQYALTDSGSVAFAGDPFYQVANVNRYNLNIPVVPAAVTFPTSSQQVAAIVKCAADNGYHVQAKSGGHSYGNYGLGGTDGAVVVDLKNLQQFSMDSSNWVATIGSGTLLGDVTQHLHDAGGRAMSHGTCPQVGSGGHFTIGGLGPTSRQFGAALDHIVEAEVVLANSSIVTASETQNSDIFWAIKGAASGFGIVTEFKVRTEPEPGTAVKYEYTLKIGSTEERATLFKQWQAYVSNPKLTRKLASTLTLLEDTMVITGTFFGTEEEYESLDIGSQWPGVNGSAVVFQDWLGLVGDWAEEAALELGGGIASNFYSKSTAWTPDNLMTSETIDQLFDYIDSADKGTLIWFLLFDFQGGYTNDIPTDATAYAHRDVLIWLQSYSINLLGPVSQTQIEYLEQVNNLVTNDKAPYAAYPGYVDPLMAAGPEAYWGSNLLRLQQIKKEIDPQNVFKNPQSPSPAF